MGIGVPTFGDVGRRGVERVVPLVVEGDGLESVFGFLDVGAGSDSIILEELRSACLSLRICIGKTKPLDLRNDLDLISWAVISGLNPLCIFNKFINYMELY